MEVEYQYRCCEDGRAVEQELGVVLLLCADSVTMALNSVLWIRRLLQPNLHISLTQRTLFQEFSNRRNNNH